MAETRYYRKVWRLAWPRIWKTYKAPQGILAGVVIAVAGLVWTWVRADAAQAKALDVQFQIVTVVEVLGAWLVVVALWHLFHTPPEMHREGEGRSAAYADDLARAHRHVDGAKAKAGTLVPFEYNAIITGTQTEEGEWVPPGFNVTMGRGPIHDDKGNTSSGTANRIYGKENTPAHGVGNRVGIPRWYRREFLEEDRVTYYYWLGDVWRVLFAGRMQFSYWLDEMRELADMELVDELTLRVLRPLDALADGNGELMGLTNQLKSMVDDTSHGTVLVSIDSMEKQVKAWIEEVRQARVNEQR